MLIASRTPEPDSAEAGSSSAVDDVRAVRERVRDAMRAAAHTSDDGERRRLLTFVVIGAGQTGVALAGSVAEAVARHTGSELVVRDPAGARVVLVDAGLRVLPGFARSLSSVARDALKRLGVELRLGVAPSATDAEGIVLAGKRIPSATVFWAGSEEPRTSRFAPVCRGYAVAEVWGLRLSGRFAWLVWQLASAWPAREPRAVALGRGRAPAIAARLRAAGLKPQDRSVLACR